MWWPLLNDTGRWNVQGVDLGANTEHNGRLYFFFGDAAAPPNYPNYDLVCWTADTTVQRHGGHQAIGWKFFIPNNYQPATGQSNWRFCDKCHGLFWADTSAPGGTPGTVCPAGGTHSYNLYSWNFILPNDHQGAPVGQWNWRYCANCRSLFYSANGQPAGKCPVGNGQHVPVGWNFCLPNDQQGANASTGQPDWRFCAHCNGIFYNGYSAKGVCPGAPGGGFRLNGVLDSSGKFAPFTVDAPIGLLGGNETPTGAFSHSGRAYVFIWVGSPRGSLSAGSYLTSKCDPSAPGNYRIEQQISALDFSRTGFWQVAPVKVLHSQFPGVFPASSGSGVVLFGHGHNVLAGQDAIHLAWSPLPAETACANAPLGPLSLQYYTGGAGQQAWSSNANDALPLVPRNKYTSVSVAWLSGPGLWILIYGTANPIEDGGPYTAPIMARLAATPFDLANAPDIPIFDPTREQAYTKYMHWPNTLGGPFDNMHTEAVPGQPPGKNSPGWAYGAYLVNRYTTYNHTTKQLDLYYLLSTSSPYQVHLMQTTLRLT